MTENDEDSGEDKFLGRWKRREVAKAAMGVGGLSAGAGLFVPLTRLTPVTAREFTGELYTDGTYLVDDAGERITEEVLEFGERITVFPETNPGAGDAPTLLVRFDEDVYTSPTELAFTVSGYAAYSKVCTHAGCMVSESEDGDLLCPCHLATYDPTRGAAVTGGPAPRALPQLPITLSSDGYLVATDNFE